MPTLAHPLPKVLSRLGTLGFLALGLGLVVTQAPGLPILTSVGLAVLWNWAGSQEPWGPTWRWAPLLVQVGVPPIFWGPGPLGWGLALGLLAVTLGVVWYHRETSPVSHGPSENLATNLEKLGLSLSQTLHDWEGRLALQSNLFGLLREEIQKAPPGGPSWDTIHRLLGLIHRTNLETVEWGHQWRQRYLGPSPHLEEPGFLVQAFWEDCQSAYRLGLGLDPQGSFPPDLLLPRNFRLPLAFILDNLARNAKEAGASLLGVDFTRKGRGFLLTVTNDGPPMVRCQGCSWSGCNPRESGCFQPGLTDKPGGSGLGMVSILELIEAFGGRLSLEDRHGKTSFVFHFSHGLTALRERPV